MFSPLKPEVLQSLIEIAQINSDDSNYNKNHVFDINTIFGPIVILRDDCLTLSVDETCGCLIGTTAYIKSPRNGFAPSNLWGFLSRNISYHEFNWLFHPAQTKAEKIICENKNITPQHEDRHKAVARLVKYIKYKMRKADLFDMYEVARNKEDDWMISAQVNGQIEELIGA